MDICYRFDGNIYVWEFEEDDKEFIVRGNGKLVFNSIMYVLNVVIDGIGLVYVFE